MDVKPVEAVAAKARYQRRVDIYYPVFKLPDERRVEDYHEPGENDEVDLPSLKLRGESLGIALSVRIVLSRDDDPLDIMRLRALEGVGAVLRRDDDRDLAALYAPALFGVEYRLKIGSAAGHEDGDLFLFVSHKLSSRCIWLISLRTFRR